MSFNDSPKQNPKPTSSALKGFKLVVSVSMAIGFVASVCFIICATKLLSSSRLSIILGSILGISFVSLRVLNSLFLVLLLAILISFDEGFISFFDNPSLENIALKVETCFNKLCNSSLSRFSASFDSLIPSKL